MVQDAAAAEAAALADEAKLVVGVSDGVDMVDVVGMAAKCGRGQFDRCCGLPALEAQCCVYIRARPYLF